MATTSSPSATQDGHGLSTTQMDPPSISNSAASRRLPPPCWSHDETVALIDAYREKWYSLRRGNLRASHWQEVADDVEARCPVNPSKTSVQCRHKMEKLRKRYRAEIQRAASNGRFHNPNFISSWVHFNRMDAMERGPGAAAPPDEEDLGDDQEDLNPNSIKRIGDIYNSSRNNNVMNNPSTFHTPANNGGGGFRIRLPTRATAKVYSKYDEMGMQNPSPSSNFRGSSKVSRVGYGARSEAGRRVGLDERKKSDPIAQMVGAIRVLGEGFVRMEKMKMEMAQELEQMRMEMEVKRTEMILESQQQIVEAFSNAISERKSKRAKRIPSPEC